jgi:hypothetical protein
MKRIITTAGFISIIASSLLANVTASEGNYEGKVAFTAINSSNTVDNATTLFVELKGGCRISFEGMVTKDGFEIAKDKFSELNVKAKMVCHDNNNSAAIGMVSATVKVSSVKEIASDKEKFLSISGDSNVTVTLYEAAYLEPHKDFETKTIYKYNSELVGCDKINSHTFLESLSILSTSLSTTLSDVYEITHGKSAYQAKDSCELQNIAGKSELFNFLVGFRTGINGKDPVVSKLIFNSRMGRKYTDEEAIEQLKIGYGAVNKVLETQSIEK